MANILTEKDGLIDGMPRDERGFWKPDKEIGLPNPVLSWPPKPYELVKWLKEYLWPFNIIYTSCGDIDLALSNAGDVAHDRIPRRLDPRSLCS